ncbi:MAG: hypothetical protein V4750_02755 [Pseudomonadota bacterium]
MPGGNQFKKTPAPTGNPKNPYRPAPAPTTAKNAKDPFHGTPVPLPPPPPKPLVTVKSPIAKAIEKKSSIPGGPNGVHGKGVPVATVDKAIEKAVVAAKAKEVSAPIAPTTTAPTPIVPIKATKVTATAPIKLDMSLLEGEYSAARDRAGRREAGAVQSQRDAIARRAAMGGGGISGALQKQESLAIDASAQRLGDVNSEIDAAKAGELRKARDMETQLNFQAGQNDVQRQFAADEAAAGRQSAADALNSDVALRQRAMEIQQGQFGQSMKQAFDAFEWEKYVDTKNLDLAARIQKMNEEGDGGLLGGLFGGLLGKQVGGAAAGKYQQFDPLGQAIGIYS